MKIQPSSIGDEFPLFSLVHLLWCFEVDLDVLDIEFTSLSSESASAHPLLLKLAGLLHALGVISGLRHVHEDIQPVTFVGSKSTLLQRVKGPSNVMGASIQLLSGNHVLGLITTVQVTGLLHLPTHVEHDVEIFAESLPVGLSHGHVVVREVSVVGQVGGEALGALSPVGVLGVTRMRHSEADVHAL